MAVAYDTFGTGTVVFGATSITSGSFTVASTADRGIAIALYHNANNCTGITASSNSVSGSLVSGTDTGTAQARRTMIFGVPAANSGAQTATASWTTATDAYLIAAAYNGVDQTTPFNGGNSGNGATGAPSITPTTGGANDASFGAYSCTGGTGTLQTLLAHLTGTTLNLDGSRGAANAAHGCSDYFSTWVGSAVNAQVPTATAPVFTVHPSNQQANSGSTATFSATATGATSYQWQVNKNGAGWVSVTGGSGATTDTYTTGTLDGSEINWIYRLAATNATGTTYSNSATLTVLTGIYYIKV